MLEHTTIIEIFHFVAMILAGVAAFLFVMNDKTEMNATNCFIFTVLFLLGAPVFVIMISFHFLFGSSEESKEDDNELSQVSQENN